jgi:hypothetical protein
MSTRFTEEEDCVPPLFRPFTRDSLAAIEARIAEEEARKTGEPVQVLLFQALLLPKYHWIAFSIFLYIYNLYAFKIMF